VFRSHISLADVPAEDVGKLSARGHLPRLTCHSRPGPSDSVIGSGFAGDYGHEPTQRAQALASFTHAFNT